MGLFSYICPKCGTAVRYGEKCVLRHIRHGELLGTASGTYDGYGRVMEDGAYRNDAPCNINSHDQIWKSEYCFEDSKFFRAKIYEGKLVDWTEFVCMYTGKPWKEVGEIPESAYALWKTLPDFTPKHFVSGTSAYHKYCFERITDAEKERLILSKRDPDQGCGKIREKYK